jgi:hypothetical protein
VLRAFSRRREQIEAFLAGGETTRARTQAAAIETRQAKGAARDEGSDRAAARARLGEHLDQKQLAALLAPGRYAPAPVDARRLGSVFHQLLGEHGLQFAESLTLFIEFGDRSSCGIVLESAAFLADAIWAAIEVPPPALFRERHDHLLAEARRRLGEAGCEAAWDAGRRVPLRATVELLPVVHASAGVFIVRPARQTGIRAS